MLEQPETSKPPATNTNALCTESPAKAVPLSPSFFYQALSISANHLMMEAPTLAKAALGATGPGGPRWAGNWQASPWSTRTSTGRLEVFAWGFDRALWHNWQVAPNGGWSGWASLKGELTSDPVVAHNADGRLEVFGRGLDNALWHIWQTAPNNGWSEWASLGGNVTDDYAVAANADGRLEAFARATDSSLWHNWQNSPGGDWSGWAAGGGGLSQQNRGRPQHRWRARGVRAGNRFGVVAQPAERFALVGIVEIRRAAAGQRGCRPQQLRPAGGLRSGDRQCALAQLAHNASKAFLIGDPGRTRTSDKQLVERTPGGKYCGEGRP